MVKHSKDFRAALREFTLMMLDKMSENKHNNSLIENQSFINSFLEIEESKEADILREKLLERYEIKDIIYSGIEDMTTVSLNEDVFDNSKDKEEILKHMSSLKKIIPDLIARLIKVGAKASVNMIARGAKAAYKAGKSNPEVVKNVFYSLLFLAVGLIGNNVKDKYNEHPVIPGTQIETTTVDGNKAMVVYSDKDTIVVSQPTENAAPVVTTATDDKTANYNNVSPIKLLEPGETKISYYHISAEMLNALWEVEKFVDHIYDAKKPSRVPKSQRELLDGSDWTIGAGHKLTTKECKEMSFRKTLTVEQGKELFKKDMQEHERLVNSMLKTLPYDSKVNYSQGFFDGVVSIEMNMGSGNFRGNATKPPCEFWRRLNNCRIDKKNGCINKSDIEYSLAKINTQNVILKGHKTRRRAEYFIAMQPYGKVDASLYKLKG